MVIQKLTFLDVVQIDGHVGVTIRTRVFVPESNGVHQLVHSDTGPVACDAAVVETQLLGASIGRHATISTYAAPAPILFDKSNHYGYGNTPSIDSFKYPVPVFVI